MWQVEASSEPEPSSPVSAASGALYPKRMPRLSGTVLQGTTFGLVSWVRQTGQAPDLRVPLRAGLGFRVWGLGFRVKGSDEGVIELWGLGFRVYLTRDSQPYFLSSLLLHAV